MKKVTYILTILFLFISILSFGQITQEQQKQAEEAQKKAMEMMKNNPQFKETLKMMESAKEQRKQERMRELIEAEKKQKDRNKKHLEEFYWRNKVASDTNGKFDNWKWGAVNLAYYDGNGKMDQKGNYIDKKYVILGGISSSGLVNMNLPKAVKTNRIISNGLFPQMYDERNEEVTFSKPDTPYLWAGFTLQVIKNGKQIGTLYMGNSERTTHNLTSPNIMGKYGDEGYLLYWAYAGGACKASANKIQKGYSFPFGENNIKLDKQVGVDLAFSSGWNLIKISVDESTQQAGQKWATKKTYATISDLPSDMKYYYKLK